MRKREKVSALIKKCDNILSLLVRKRDKCCVCCGSKERLQCGHYISRRKKSVRFDLMNCNAQCSGCNIKHNYDIAPYTNYMLVRYGEQELKMLCEEAKKIKQWKALELHDLIDNFTEQLNTLE